MRLYIEHKEDITGKMKFIGKLIPELQKLGVKIIPKNKPADICLSLTHWRGKFKGPRVMRIDGVHFTNDKHANWNNGRMRDDMKRSKAVIYQSPWCQKMGHGCLKYKHKREYIIFNGANPEDYENKSYAGAIDKPRILMSANWKGKTHKRLKEMCEIAAECPQYNFFVAGRHEMKLVEAENIKQLGHLDEPDLQKLIASCDIMFNLAHYDWCANAVVECLVAGKPVVYAAGTGMEDLVGDSGVKIKDSSPKLKLIKVKPSSHKHVRIKVPPIDYEEAKQALAKALEMPEIHRPDLHITAIAKQYYKVFKEVLGG